MPYNHRWDESDPDGELAAANTLDTIIQNLKSSVRERLAQVIPGWSNDEVDPKIIKLPVDLLANRPTEPANDGEPFVSSDEDTLYVGAGGTWRTVGGGGSNSSAYKARFNYVTDELNSPTNDIKQLFMTVTGVVDGTGFITVNLNDLLVTTFDIANLLLIPMVGSAASNQVEQVNVVYVGTFSTNSLRFAVYKTGATLTAADEGDEITFSFVASFLN